MLRFLVNSLVVPVFLLIAAVPAVVRGQIVNIPSDTIIRLATDPSRSAGQPAVYLLDELVSRIEPDGKWVNEVRQVLHVISPAAARGYSERAFTWSPSRQQLSIRWVRVLKPTGEVVSDRVAQEQDSDIGAELANPVYQATRRKRISISNVAPNTIIDIAYTVKQTEPYRLGDFLFSWTFANRIPVVNSTFRIDVPRGFTPRVLEQNLTFRKEQDTVAGREVTQWSQRNLTPYMAERFEPDSNGLTMSVLVGAPSTWSDITAWYDSLAKPRYVLSSDVQTRIDSLVKAANARTRLDTVRALHRWVAQDFRYVSIALGMGGYQPRSADEMFDTGFGDCKDKATLFVAALRRYKIPAYTVLLSISGRANKAIPSVHQFDHAIAAVGDGASRVYTDLTADVIPYGLIPASYAGSFATVVAANGKAEEVRLPLLPVDSSRSVVRMTLNMDSTGAIRGRVEQEARGMASFNLRSLFAQPLDSVRRTNIVRSLSNSMFPNSNGDSLLTFNGRDFNVLPKISFVFSTQGTLRNVGASKLLTLPPIIRGNAAGYSAIAKELSEARPRQTPVDAGKILGPLETVTDVTLILPEGWRADLPQNVNASSFFGSYQSTWTQEGNTVRLVRTIKGMRGVFPAQRIVEVATWMKNVGNDNNEFLTLTPAQ